MGSLAAQNNTVTYRFDEIKRPHQQTFNWIWDEQSPLVAWLTSDHTKFWIRGKPGSGKSTLMKHIVHSYQQQLAQESRRSDDQPKIVPFSFYDLGSELQKSIDGFMFALLDACLHTDDRLAQCVIPIFQRYEKRWTTRSLREAVETLLFQEYVTMQVLVFLDALDECSQPLDELVDFVSHMTNPGRKSATHVRICLSSRPYNVFIDAFQSCPGLNIHQHTTEDMVQYIKQRFTNSTPMSALVDQDQKADKSRMAITTLINKLVDTSEGVFLWLRLAVDDILDEARDGATSVADILKHFESLGLEGPDLETLYSRILERTPTQSRKQAYIMLELVLRSYVPIAAYDFWLAEKCASCLSLQDCVDIIPIEALISQTRLDDIGFDPMFRFKYATEFALTPPGDTQDRRLRSRCGGLLERNQGNPGKFEQRPEQIVKFMHRSVKEFLIKTGLHTRWAEKTNTIENGYTFLAKYALAQLTVERRRYYDLSHLSPKYFYQTQPNWFSYLDYFAMSEATTGLSQKSLLDSATEAFAPCQSEHKDVFGLYGSALSFGVVKNLLLYVSESLVNDDTGLAAELLGHRHIKISTLLHTHKHLHINTLLHDVVRSTTSRQCYTPRDPHTPITSRGFVHRLGPNFGNALTLGSLDQMANLLLEKGANMESVFLGYTPFQLLLSSLKAREGHMCDEWEPSVIALVQVFLKHGQHPDTMFNKLGTGRTRALHLSDSRMASILLKNGASVNARNASGLTALDIAFGARGKIYEIGDHVDPNEAYSLILLLLRHGGRVTRTGRKSLPHFHEALFRLPRYSRDTVDPRVLNPPRL